MWLAHIEIRDLDDFDAWTPEIYERLFNSKQEAQSYVNNVKKNMISSERVDKEYIREIKD